MVASAIDNNGGFSEKEIFVTVENQLPVIDFTIELVDAQTREYKFTYSESDSDGFNTEIKADFTSPDGNVETFIPSVEFNYQLSTPGVWSITYTATDNHGGVSSVTKEVEVINNAPVAHLTFTKLSEREYELDASGSSDLDNNIANYKFIITSPNGGSSDIIQSETKLNYTFNEDGQWLVDLVVIDSDNFESSNSVTKYIGINYDVLPPDPGEEGKLTLAGIDSDGDGVRDDVERYIASLPLSEEAKEEFKNYSRTIQVGLLEVSDKEVSISNTYSKLDHHYCLQSKLTELEYINYSKEMLIKYYNTRERVMVWLESEANFGGQIVTVESDKTKFNEYCK